MLDRPCFKVTFSDGSEIVADADHNWYVETEASRRSGSLVRARQRRGVAPTLLPRETVQALSDLIPSLHKDQTATLSEIAALVGVSAKSYLMNILVRDRVAPVGREKRERSFSYREQVFARTRTFPLYDTAAVLRGLLDLHAQGKTGLDADAVTRMQVEIDAPVHEQIPVVEIAHLAGRLTNGRAAGAIHRAVKRTGVTPVEGRWVMQQHMAAQELTREAGAANVYPVVDVLRVVIKEGSRPRTDQTHKRSVGGVLTTEQIADGLRTAHGTANFSIPVAQPIQTPEVDLPLDPYYLGVWLGDGKSTDSRYYSADPEIAVYLEDRGFIVRRDRDSTLEHGVTWTSRDRRDPLSTPVGTLRHLGVLGNKHIPAAYLRASEAQRRDLLAGLMDTDGTVSKHGPVQFDNTNRGLIDGLYELAASLGYRPTITEKRAMLNGKDCGPVWRVSFTTPDDIFRLERKRIAQKEATRNHNPAKTSHRYIISVEPVDSVPVRCITVDSQNSLFLAGKSMIPTHNTAFTAYQFAGQLRHRNQGLVIVDPQGQWSHEQGLPFSLQGFAAEMGREVMVRRISEDIRLEKDAPLFGELLGKTRFIREIMKMAAETQEILVEELVKVLKGVDGWPDMSSAALLDKVLRGLRRPNVLRRIYSDNSKRIRLMVAFSEILGDDCSETIDGDPIEDVNQPEFRDYRLDTSENRREDALMQFAPLHNLFSATNPGGGTRHSLWGTVSRVFDKEARGANPAPVLILDMSTSGGASWIGDILADEDARKAKEAIEIIDQDGIKAAILAQVFRTLKSASEAAFRNGDNLNTRIALDEAWRFAPPPHLASDDEIKALSVSLAGYSRDLRKFGIGLTFITQTTRSINQDIWDQMTVRTLGYGLAGADIEKVAEQVDDRDHLKLYKGFAPPDSTSPKVYPFMLVGPVSPLSFSRAPIMLSAYTDFQNFRDDNAEWITQIRLSMGQQVISGTPTKPGGGMTLQARTARRSAGVAAAPPRGDRAAEQIERVRANRETGGVDMAVVTGLGTDSFGSGGLDFLDADEPPF